MVWTLGMGCLARCCEAQHASAGIRSGRIRAPAVLKAALARQIWSTGLGPATHSLSKLELALAPVQMSWHALHAHPGMRL